MPLPLAGVAWAAVALAAGFLRCRCGSALAGAAAAAFGVRAALITSAPVQPPNAPFDASYLPTFNPCGLAVLD